MLTLVFGEAPSRVMELGVKRRQVSTTQVRKVDEYRNVVTGKVESSPGSTVVKNHFATEQRVSLKGLGQHITRP